MTSITNLQAASSLSSRPRSQEETSSAVEQPHVYGYVRIGTSWGDHNALERQISAIEACAKRESLVVNEIFHNVNASGILTNREGLDRLLDARRSTLDAAVRGRPCWSDPRTISSVRRAPCWKFLSASKRSMQ